MLHDDIIILTAIAAHSERSTRFTQTAEISYVPKAESTNLLLFAWLRVPFYVVLKEMEGGVS